MYICMLYGTYTCWIKMYLWVWFNFPTILMQSMKSIQHENLMRNMKNPYISFETNINGHFVHLLHFTHYHPPSLLKGTHIEIQKTMGKHDLFVPLHMYIVVILLLYFTFYISVLYCTCISIKYIYIWCTDMHWKLFCLMSLKY